MESLIYEGILENLLVGVLKKIALCNKNNSTNCLINLERQNDKYYFTFSLKLSQHIYILMHIIGSNQPILYAKTYIFRIL